MAETINLKKRRIGKEDIDFDITGTGEQANFFTSDGGAKQLSKLNASHIPLLQETRSKVNAVNVDDALNKLTEKVDNFEASDVLGEDLTINFLPEDDTETIQLKINQQKKNLNGHTLTFLFPASLQQNLYQSLVWSDFYNGTVVIAGGTSGNRIAIYDRQDINSLFRIYRCQCEVRIEYFYFVHQKSLYAVSVESSSAVIFKDCQFSGVKASETYAVNSLAGNAAFIECEFHDDMEIYPPVSADGTGKHLGEIFAYSGATPPEGAYLLNGQTIYGCNELYPKFWEWLTASNVRSIDNDAYETELATTGVCGGFVLDNSTGNVRLPKWHYQSPLGETLPVRGNGTVLGLTNGTETAGLTRKGATGAYLLGDKDTYGDSVEKLQVDAVVDFYGKIGVTTDPDKSGIVAENNAPVDPFVWCIQVYNATTALSEQESAQLASQMQMKAQTDLANVTANIDFIIKHEEAADGSWWYDLYRSGKVVQGGYTEHATAAGSVTINLPIEMANNNYIPLLTIRGENGFYLAGGTYSAMTVSNITETSFDCYLHQYANTKAKYWRVEGKAATE